jgi:ATP-binding cassette subfamily F protein 3
MELIRFQSVRKDYGHRPVLEDVSFRITSGQKAGVIGANGAGKTTIVRILMGEEEPSGGAISRAPSLRIGYVPQFVEFDEGQTVLATLLREHDAALAELRLAEHLLADAAADELGEATAAYDAARESYERAGGDAFEARAVGMLDALGLPGRTEQPVSQLSGGEKNVLSLAQALLAEPDLLVLDEPGNHLDFSGLAWLEQFLAKYRGAVLMVSHNRYLLDRVATTILHLHGGKVDAYAGNYSDYRLTALRQKLSQQADYEANQRRLAQLEALVHRFREIASARPDPAWGKRLRARVSQLEREKAQAVERPESEASRLHMRLTSKGSKADIALQVRGYRKAFGERLLFDGADAEIACGERVALIGPNGSGKTTLLREIVSRGAWDGDTLRVGPSLKVGYCAQQQEVLDDRRTVFDQILYEPGMTRQRAFDVLEQFMFGELDFDKPVGALSGGERNRLQLALLIVRQPDFLIMDEPTNHLDIPSCEAIEEALASFKGTVLVVSHDRYFLDKVVDRVIEVRDGKLHSFNGNFSDYWMARHRIARPTKARVATRRTMRERTERPAADSKRALTLQARIEEAEGELVAIEHAVSAAFERGDHREGSRLARRLEDQRRRIDRLYAEWAAEV